MHLSPDEVINNSIKKITLDEVRSCKLRAGAI